MNNLIQYNRIHLYNFKLKSCIIKSDFNKTKWNEIADFLNW